jgi:hypothetical protein
MTAEKSVSRPGVAKKATAKSAGPQGFGAPLIRENYIMKSGSDQEYKI